MEQAISKVSERLRRSDSDSVGLCNSDPDGVGGQDAGDAPVLAKAYLPAKNHRKIGKCLAVGVRTVKIIRDDGGKKVQVQVYRGRRWQNEDIDRGLLVRTKIVTEGVISDAGR